MVQCECCPFYHVSLHSRTIHADAAAVDALMAVIYHWWGESGPIPDLRVAGACVVSPQWHTTLSLGWVSSASYVAYFRRGDRNFSPIWDHCLTLRQGFSIHRTPFVTMSM